MTDAEKIGVVTAQASNPYQEDLWWMQNKIRTEARVRLLIRYLRFWMSDFGTKQTLN